MENTYKTFERKEALLVIENVSKELEGKVILRDIGVTEPVVISNITREAVPDLRQGQIVAFIGESGSGKTTLFKMIAGIYAPTTGSLKIPQRNGTEILGYNSICAGDVGFVQQTYPLSRNQSVYQMLHDAATKGCIPKKEQREIIDDYIKTWDLWNQRFLAANQLSGGQRQRVAIIEQLLCSNHMIIFDEPFSGLDVRNTKEVKKNFHRITTTNEINTIIFSTHDIHLAVEQADCIYVVGYERDEKNNKIPGGTILEKFDLKEEGLAWSETYTAAHNELAQKIIAMIEGK